MTNTTLLKAKMIQNNKQNNDIVKALNLSRQSVSKKINNHVPFTIDEVVKVRDCIGLTQQEVMDIFLS